MSTKIKIIALGLLSLLFLIFDWYLIDIALFGNKPLTFWVWPGLITLLTISVLTLYALVNSNKLYNYGFGILSLIAYLLIFPKAWIIFLSGLIFLVLMFWFEQRIRSEEANRQHFSIRSVSTAGINLIIYAFLLSLTLNIYYNTAAQFKAHPETFYDALGRSAAKSTRFLGNQGTGIDLNLTFDEYILNETKRQNPDFEKIPKDFQKQYLEQTKQDFFRQFNVQIRGDQPLAEVIAQFAVDKVRASTENHPNLFPIIFALIILALLRTFAFVIRWLSIFVTWVLYQLLLRVRFFRISKVAVEVEKLEI